MPKSKGRASRSESGAWRRGSAEDEQYEHALSEEEIRPKLRAPSVARSTRGRPPKAETVARAANRSFATLPAVPRNPLPRGSFIRDLNRLRTIGDMAATLLGALIINLCLIGLVLYCADTIHYGNQAYQSRALAGDDIPGFHEVFYWVNNKMPWQKGFSGTAAEVETPNFVPGLQESDFICPECPCSVNPTTDPDSSPARFKDPVLYLPNFLHSSPTISNLAERVFNVAYDTILSYPSLYSLLVLLAAWKAGELLKRGAKIGWAYALRFADYMVRMYEANERVAEIFAEVGLVEEESERARREAEEKFLARMSTFEKDDLITAGSAAL